jgi:hypothetical protein
MSGWQAAGRTNVATTTRILYAEDGGNASPGADRGIAQAETREAEGASLGVQ